MVNAKILSASKMQGIRAAVYKLAEEHLARYFMSKEKTFYYDEQGDLIISALFLAEDRAEAEKFQSALNLWHLQNFLAALDGKVQVEKAIQVVYQNNICQDSSAPTIPERVFLNDYKGTDSDSPMSSLGDFRATCASSSTEALLNNDDLVIYQSLENQDCFRVCEAYRLHIKDKASSSQDLKKNINNLLAGSWTPFHQLFDGLATSDNIPKLAIRFIQACPEKTLVSENRRRQRVDLALEFQDEESARLMEGRLKLGSTRVNALEWRSFVHVEDVDTFQECLEWKYRKTKEIWGVFDAD